MDKKYFKILDINPNATLEEIKQAYRDLAQIWHPDYVSTKNPRLKKKAEEKMKEINEARSKAIAYLTEKQMRKTAEHNGWERAEQERAARERAARWEAAKKAEQTRTRKNGGDHEADFKKYLVLFLPVFVISVGIIFFYWKNDIKIKHTQQVPSPQPQHPEAVLKKPIKKQPPLIPVQQGKGKNKTDNIISEAENHLKSRQYLKSKTSDESALEMISDGQFKKDSLLRTRKRKIEESLLNKDVVYGSQGLIKHENIPIAPKDYQKHFVKYKGSVRHYKELKNIITQITDSHIRIYLIKKYHSQNIHKNDVDCYKIALNKNSKSSSHFRVFYKWEIWTFKIIKEGELSLDIVYNSETDRWQVGKIYEKKSG